MTLEERLEELAENAVKGIELADLIMQATDSSRVIPDLTAMVVTMTATGEYSFCASMDSGEAIAVLRKVIAELEATQN